MTRCLFTFALILSFTGAWSQITITAADMPVAGDTLRYSEANAFGSPVSAADSGAGMNWVYNLVPTGQGRDDYKKPAQVNPLYTLTLPPNSYGYKIADSIPGLSLLAPGIAIQNLYTFFNKYTTPSAYVADCFGATVSGFPIGATYIIPDVWYLFPLAYHNDDSLPFYLKFGLASVASLKQKGYRKTRVDGWGTITTPYFATPTNCIRVRSEINEVDSVSLDSLTFGLPRVSVEYKWLVKGEHYPAVWASGIMLGGVELITTLKYRDIYRDEFNEPNAVSNVAAGDVNVMAYPNPTTNGTVVMKLPASWKVFSVELFDMQSRSVALYNNTHQIDMQLLPAGTYLARVTTKTETAYVKIVKER